MPKITESSDKLFLEYSDLRGEIQRVPKSFMDEIAERQLSPYILESLLEFHYLNRDYHVQECYLSDIVGQDLTGKYISVFISDWEDSEWVYTDGVIKVEVVNNDYVWTFAPEIEALRKLIQEGQDDEEEGEYKKLEDAALNAGYTEFEQFLYLNLNTNHSVRVLTPR